MNKEPMMTHQEAYQVLEGYLDHYTVQELYDDFYDQSADFRDAIMILIPDFEYPDHSHKTIRQIKKQVQHTLNAE
jgi:hypothetical protein